jgi:hypothetical protein
VGAIASANQVLKNSIRRDQLRNERRAKAVEMEGSGIADLAWTRSIEYFVVRGICDYCDANKRDNWQDYASVVAAAYTRVLLSTLSSSGKRCSRLGSLTAVAVTVLMAAISAVALIQGNAPAKRTAQLYVEAVQPPIELKIDGVFIRTLTEDLPFTSVDLGEGNHRVVATFNGLRYEQLVQLKGGTRIIVRIPPMAR